MGILVYTSLPSTLLNMKGFVIFSLLIVGVYSGPLKEIRLNIKDEAGCGGENLRIKIRRDDGRECETYNSLRFHKGAILKWKSRQWNLWNSFMQWVEWDRNEDNIGSCWGFEFDQNAEFSLVLDGNDGANRGYCPAQIEFLAYELRSHDARGYGRVASFKRNMDNSCRNRRCSQRDNNSWFACSFDSWFNAIPNSEFVIANNQVTCPSSQEQACPVNELQSVRRRYGRSRRQCYFSCPSVKRVREYNGGWKILGQTCHEVTFVVPEYDYCCRRPGTGFEQCQDQPTPRPNCYGNNQNCNVYQQTEYVNDNRQNSPYQVSNYNGNQPEYGNDNRQPYPNQRRNCNGNHQNCNGNQQTEYGNDNRQPYPNQRRNCNGNQQNCNGNQQTEY